MEIKLKNSRPFETDCTFENLYNKFEDGKLTIFVKSLTFCEKDYKNLPIYTFKQDGNTVAVEYHKTDITDLDYDKPGTIYFEGLKLLPNYYEFKSSDGPLIVSWHCMQYELLQLVIANYSYNILSQLEVEGKFKVC